VSGAAWLLTGNVDGREPCCTGGPLAISTVIAAVRLRRYEMALGDVFGTHLSNAALILVIDLLAPGPPLLDRAGSFAAFGALLGLVLTAIFVAGVLRWRDRTV